MERQPPEQQDHHYADVKEHPEGEIYGIIEYHTDKAYQHPASQDGPFDPADHGGWMWLS